VKEETGEDDGEREGEEALARQDGTGSLARQQQQRAPALCLLLPPLRLRRSPMVYRLPVMPSSERSDRKEQKSTVEARLGEGDTDGEGEGRETFGMKGKV